MSRRSSTIWFKNYYQVILQDYLFVGGFIFCIKWFISNCFEFVKELMSNVKKHSSKGVLREKVFLKISQNWQENICARISFLISFLAQVFFCEFGEIFKNTFYYRTSLVAASGLRFRFNKSFWKFRNSLSLLFPFTYNGW